MANDKKILVVGDMHAPFACTKTLSKIYEIAKDEKPDFIVQLGDLYDFFCFSRYARSMDWMLPGEELAEGRAQAEEFWKTIKKAAPKAQCFQILGNHDERPVKRVLEKAPELEAIAKVHDYFKFPGVRTLKDAREELVIGDILFHHGYLSGKGQHKRKNGMKFVGGHSHLGYVDYEVLAGKVLWELNAGYVGDPTSPVFAYTPQKANFKTRGVGLIDKYGPRFICLEPDERK
jgi:predicted phosphodiesterase